MPNKIQLRRGNKANLPILDSGEPGFVLDTEELYIGKGTKNVKFLSESDLSVGSGLSYVDGVINNIDMGSTAISQHLSNYDHDPFNLSVGSGLSYVDDVISNIDMGSTAISQHLSDYDHDSFGEISWETIHW